MVINKNFLWLFLPQLFPAGCGDGVSIHRGLKKLSIQSSKHNQVIGKIFQTIGHFRFIIIYLLG